MFNRKTAGSLLSAIRTGTALRKVDHEQVAKEKEESSDSLFKSLEDTMKMALGIRRAVMETQVIYLLFSIFK